MNVSYLVSIWRNQVRDDGLNAVAGKQSTTDCWVTCLKLCLKCEARVSCVFASVTGRKVNLKVILKFPMAREQVFKPGSSTSDNPSRMHLYYLTCLPRSMSSAIRADYIGISA